MGLLSTEPAHGQGISVVVTVAIIWKGTCRHGFYRDHQPVTCFFQNNSYSVSKYLFSIYYLPGSPQSPNVLLWEWPSMGSVPLSE